MKPWYQSVQNVTVVAIAVVLFAILCYLGWHRWEQGDTPEQIVTTTPATRYGAN